MMARKRQRSLSQLTLLELIVESNRLDKLAEQLCASCRQNIALSSSAAKELRRRVMVLALHHVDCECPECYEMHNDPSTTGPHDAF